MQFLYRDSKGQTPYLVAPDKDTRNVFRKYMGENPDRYDYSKAQVRVNNITSMALNRSKSLMVYTCANAGPWAANGGDGVQINREEKSSKGAEKTAGERAAGREEETRDGGRGKEEVCVSDRS